MAKGFYVKVDPSTTPTWKAVNGFFVKTSQTAWKSITDAWVKVDSSTWKPFYTAATAPDTPVEILTSFNTSQEIQLQGKNYHWTPNPATLQYKFSVVNKETPSSSYDITSYTNTTNPSSGSSSTLPSSSTYQTITKSSNNYFAGATNVFQFIVIGTTSAGGTFTTKAEYEFRIPAAPTVSATALSGTSVKLTVTAASSADWTATTRYIVYTYDTTGGTITSGGGRGGYDVSVSASNPYEITLTGLTSGRLYYFYVAPTTGNSGTTTSNANGYLGVEGSTSLTMPIGPGDLTNVTNYSFTTGYAQGFFTTSSNTTSVQYYFQCDSIPGIQSSTYTLSTSNYTPYKVQQYLLGLFTLKTWNYDTYNAGTTYYYNNTVWYAGNQYRANYVGINSGFTGQIPTNTTYWTLIQAVTYNPGDYVLYNGTYYFCKLYSNGVYPSNTTYWTSSVTSWTMYAKPYNSSVQGNLSAAGRTLLIYPDSYGDALRISSGPTFSLITSSSFRTTFLPSTYTDTVIFDIKKNGVSLTGYPQNVSVSGGTQTYQDSPNNLTASTAYSVYLQSRYTYSYTYGVYHDGETTSGSVSTAAPNAAVPTGITVSRSGTSVNVSWNRSTNATTYRVYWNTTGTTSADASTSYDAQVADPGSGTTASTSFTNLTTAATYYFWVSATSGNGTWTAYSSSTPASIALTAPSAASVSVSPTTGTAGTTTYTATPSASGSPTITYSYQWKYWDQGSTYLSISGATSSTYSPPSNFTSLYGNSLRCDIVASNGIGTNATAVSNVVSVSAAVVAPGLPTSLSATTTRTDGVNLTFSGSSGATSYDIFWNTSQGAWPSTSATPDFTGVSSPYLDTTISSGVTRYYWVRGRNSAGTSNWYPYQTNGVTGTRLVAVSNATAPTSVGATGGNTTVTVSWSGATNATKYRIWWSTSSTGNGVDPSVSFDAETTLTSYTFTGMSNGTTYYFWVSASNTNSVWTAYSSSPRASATPSAGTSAPATPTGVSVSGSGLVSWTASSGATSYTIQYYLANDATASVSSSGPYSGTSTGTTFQVTYQTGLNWARARVLANNSGGSSAYSAWYPSSTTYV